SRARAARADAAAVVQRVTGVLKRTPDGGRLGWRLDVPAGLTLAIDEADLAEALGALAENAARHANAQVTVSALPQEDQVRLCIADDGPGMPAARLSAMTARGTRADETQGGTGLGLTIAAEIARAAGGDITLCNAHPGLTVCLTLPRSTT
ncbi:ATP-binding protein, partial [Roseovarius salis]|uniref:ATP-binding protein n=1 Tax=Roseovarius salis TaxID=3376063 RepID=UPI0037C6F56F